MDNIVDKIYCVNLDCDRERYENAEIQFKKHNLNVERFSGINGPEIKVEDYPGIIEKNSWLLKNKCGSTGCYLSHIKIWDQILADDSINIALILEDDIILNSDFNNKFLNYYKQVPDNWELLYLGTGKMIGKNINTKVMKPKIGNHIGHNNGTFGYMIKKSAIPKIKKLILPIDHKTIDYVIRSNFNKIKAYFFTNNLVRHNYNFTPTKKHMDKNYKK
jgi:GR25 family glycosyltransferase involved in LPS biosynthesis